MADLRELTIKVGQVSDIYAERRWLRYLDKTKTEPVTQ